MKIQDVKIYVIQRELRDAGGADMKRDGVSTKSKMGEIPVLNIITDEGLEGTSFGRDGLMAAQYLDSVKSMLIGEDPHYVERIWQKLWSMNRVMHLPDTVLGVVDIAIWDILGKSTGLPIYKLLGAYRDKVKVYATCLHYTDKTSYVELALELKEKGFKGFKPHISGDPDFDIDVCRAIREAVGDEMVLMLDPVGLYDREQALRVGRELEKLNFTWFEEPIQDTDMIGLKKLCDTLDIPVAALEVLPGSLYTKAQYITQGAVDIIRSDTLYNGGITPLKKAASLAEAFGMRCEIHCNPNALANAANLHVTCSIKNCEFYEWMVPAHLWDFGLRESIQLDADGYAHVPQKPGLGLEVDWDFIKSQTVATL